MANDRLADAEQRAVAFDKGNKENKPAPSGIKDDLARAEKDKARLEQDVAAKEKAKGDTQTTYARETRINSVIVERDSAARMFSHPRPIA